MSTPFGLAKQTVFLIFTTGLMNQCMISPNLSVPGYLRQRVENYYQVSQK
jgi:hypothetical protein